MDSCDVLIVGGGPAGSTCAGLLREAGLDVLLLDSKEFPRDKACAGWITPAVLETLAIDKHDYRQGRVLQDIRGFVTSVMNETAIVTSYDAAVSYGIRRNEFDDYLLERSGCRRMLGEPVTFFERRNGYWLVNGHIRARLLVGAGGHTCPVARLLGAQFGEESIIVAQVAEIALSNEEQRLCPVAVDTPELLFCRDLQGYGWLIRKEGILNIGFGRMDRSDFGRHMDGFRACLQSRGGLPSASGVHFQGHAYCAWLRQGGRRRVGEGALLIGDAAGLANQHSGEGILPAIESALLAAQTILEARGDYRRDNLEAYTQLLNRRYGGSRGEICWPGFSDLQGRVGSRLFSSRLFVRHIALNRCFLHRNQKPLSSLSA